MLRLAFVTLLAGCESFFPLDATSDAAPADAAKDAPDADICVGHDEDGDGHVDVCDNCPTIANLDQTNDLDADKIGDECDPQMGTAEVVLYYDPFEIPDRIVTTTAQHDSSNNGFFLLASSNGKITTSTAVPNGRVVVIRFEFLANVVNDQSVELQMGSGIACRLDSDLNLCSSPSGANTCIMVDPDGRNGAAPPGGIGSTTLSFDAIDQLTMIESAQIGCKVGSTTQGGAGSLVSDPVTVAIAGDIQLRVTSLVVYGD